VTTTAKRKAISPKTRFEVFKRDGFKCLYCGAHPPGVLLEVDHIVAVVEGGAHDMDNFATACWNCNRGKGARDLKTAPKTLAAKARETQEREAQLLGYQAILEAKRDRIEDELWRVADALVPGSSKDGMSRDWTASIRRFNELLGVHSVLEAVDIALAAPTYTDKRLFRYFCGVCWNRVRALGGGDA
jgi:hypothetical protein